MVILGVKIDHVATLRQARKIGVPDPVAAAMVCEKAGARGITVHLREDRRHIQLDDVVRLRQSINTKLNLEMAAVAALAEIAATIGPDDVCLVPEKRQELTTEGGLDVAGNKKKIAPIVKRLKDVGICVSLFIDPDERQISAAAEIGADCVELHTGAYAHAFPIRVQRIRELKKIVNASEYARQQGLTLNAGHGLDYENVSEIARIEGMNELNIGFSIIAHAVFVGLAKAVREMNRQIKGR
ncbi:MAG: pyridoxine 5'-phosphate synthase [Endomicrobiales bacterium]